MKTDLVIQVDTFGKYCEDEYWDEGCGFMNCESSQVDCILFGQKLRYKKPGSNRIERCEACLNAAKHFNSL